MLSPRLIEKLETYGYFSSGFELRMILFIFNLDPFHIVKMLANNKFFILLKASEDIYIIFV